MLPDLFINLQNNIEIEPGFKYVLLGKEPGRDRTDTDQDEFIFQCK